MLDLQRFRKDNVPQTRSRRQPPSPYHFPKSLSTWVPTLFDFLAVRDPDSGKASRGKEKTLIESWTTGTSLISHPSSHLVTMDAGRTKDKKEESANNICFTEGISEAYQIVKSFQDRSRKIG